MNFLIIENNYSCFSTPDKEIKDLIWKCLRFRDPKAYYSSAFRMKFWDGFFDFFKKESGKFLTGLLPEVKLILKSNNIQYEIQDKRQPFSFKVDKVDENLLLPTVILRDYQVDYINQVIKYKRGIIPSPTGCHRKEQLISMYDGTTKKVEDIIVGDKVMGMNNQPREVLFLNRGFGNMVEICPYKWNNFVVNDDHILTLISDNTIIDVKITDYLLWSKTQKENFKLFKSSYLVNAFSIKRLDKKEDYYGFTLDGDGRYLLSDFIVTHNSGKSLTCCGIVSVIPENTPTLILCNKKQLVEQCYEDLCRVNVKNVGKLHGTVNKPNIITCATVQSADKLGKLLSEIKVLIVDEVHEMTSKTAKAIYSKLRSCSVRVGMSATAFKNSGADKIQKFEVKGLIGPVFKTTTTEDGKLTTKNLQDRNILSKSKCAFFVIDKPVRLYDVFSDALKYGISQNSYLNEFIRDLIAKLDGRILILVDRIEHGEILHQLIPDSLWVKGEDTLEIRKEAVKRLKYDKEKVVVIATTGIMSVGVDVFCHYLINVGGKSSHIIIQRMGRGMRKAEDKDGLNYIDFMFTNNQYLENHSKKRIKTLEKEGHEVKIYKTIEEWEKS